MAVLLNWLWLGVVVAFGSALLMRAIGPLGPRPRYRIWSAALAIVLALPFAPLLVAMLTMWTMGGSEAAASPLFVVSVPHASWMSSAILPLAWSTWIALFLIRVIRGIALLGRARRESSPWPSDRDGTLPHWRTVRSGGRRARLVLSTRISSAAVLGFRAPLIAVSPRLLDRLSPADLDRIILHEWAHVQRRDDIAQMVQIAARAVAGWHPAVWWIDRQITLERELACDEEVMRITGAGRDYASCLVNLAALTPRRMDLMPAPGAIGASQLRRRVIRMLALGSISSARRSTASVRFTPALLLVLAAMTAALTGVDIVAVNAAENWLPALPTASSIADAITTPNSRATVALDVFRGTQGRAQNNGVPIVHDGVSSGLPGQTISGPDRAPVFVTPAGSVNDLVSGATVMAPEVTAPVVDRAAVGSPLEAESLAVHNVAEGSATLWDAAADAGAAIGEGSRRSGAAVGQGSRKSAVATAGLFTRVGKKIAGSF